MGGLFHFNQLTKFVLYVAKPKKISFCHSAECWMVKFSFPELFTFKLKNMYIVDGDWNLFQSTIFSAKNWVMV